MSETEKVIKNLIKRVVKHLEVILNFDFDENDLNEFGAPTYKKIRDKKVENFKTISENEFDILSNSASCGVYRISQLCMILFFSDNDHNPVCVMLHGWYPKDLTQPRTVNGKIVKENMIKWREYYDLRQDQFKEEK